MAIITVEFSDIEESFDFHEQWFLLIYGEDGDPTDPPFYPSWTGPQVMMDGEQDSSIYGITFDSGDVYYRIPGSNVLAYSYGTGWTDEKYRKIFYNTSTGPANVTAWIQKLAFNDLATIGGTMPNTYNVAIVNGTTYIDLSQDDVTPAQVLATVTKFHNADGAIVSGTIASKAAATYNVSTSDQTIAAGQYLSGPQTIRAVTTSNISAANIKAGVTIKVGDAADDDRITSATGTFTSDATITTTGASGSKTSSELLTGKTAYANGEKVTGSMANRGSNNVTVSTVAGTTIPAGYYNGGGKAVIDSASASELSSGAYILTGHTILGVAGTLNPSSEVTHAALSAASSFAAQTIAPADKDVQFFDTVTIAPVSVSETLTTGTSGYTISVSDGVVA